MARKFSQFTNGLTNQSPTDTLVGLDLSLPTNQQNTYWTLNSLFSVITRNITDGALRFQGFAAPSVSAAGQGSLYFDSSTNKFKISQNGGAYANLENGLSGLVNGNLVKANSTTTATDSGIVSTQAANSVSSRYNVLDYASLAAAVAAIGSSTEATLVIPTSTAVTTSLTVTENITLEFTNAGALNISAAQTATIQGSINAPMRQIFTGAGIVAFTNNRRLGRLFPQWWGAFPNNTISTTACNAAITAAKTFNGTGGGEVYFSPGTWRASLVITEARGIELTGNSRISTIIAGTGGEPALACNGLWYSQFTGLQFQVDTALVGKGVVELDGNYDGVHTLGVQANTFKDCLFNAQNIAPYAFTMCRQGTSSAQGSENLFLNCHFASANGLACYYQVGFNALNNTFIGGNFQYYPQNGIYLVAGSVEVYSVGFQPVQVYTQVSNAAFDINASGAGVGEGITVFGCRSEGLQFYKGGASQKGNIQSFNQSPAVTTWGASQAFPLNTVVVGATTDGNKVFQVTTAGTSGLVEPTWPTSGTVADGSITWTLLATTLIDLPAGLYEPQSSTFVVGAINVKYPQYLNVVLVTTNYTIQPTDGMLLVDPTSGPITISLPASPAYATGDGHSVIVKRKTTAANRVTVTGIDTDNTIYLEGDTLDALEITQTGGGANQWRIVNYFSSQFGGYFNELAANPTSTNLNNGRWALYKNTTSGVLSLWANDGGVMKSVALT